MIRTELHISHIGWRKGIIPIFLFSLFIAVILLWYNFSHFLSTPASKTPRLVVVTVAEGASFHSVARQLKNKGVISDDFRFTMMARALGVTRSIQAGDYESWTDASGAKQERTEWHRIVVFGKLAEICGKYLNKGKLVYLSGRIQTRQWEDRDGNKRYTTEIVAQEMKMLSGGQQQAERSYETPQSPGPPDALGEDDDIPF